MIKPLPWDDPNHDVIGDLQEAKARGYDSYGVSMRGSMAKQEERAGPPQRPQPKVIVAFDPGKTTGIRWWIAPTPREPELWGYIQVEACNSDVGLIEVVRHLSRAVHGNSPSSEPIDVHIIGERFEDRLAERYRDKIDFTAAEVIGAVRLWVAERSVLARRLCVQLILSGASLGKGFWTDDKIKAIGLWVPGNKHAMDATRHLLRYRLFALEHNDLLEKFKPELTIGE